MSPPLRLLTRASALARWQAEHVRDRLAAHGVEATLVLVETRGDADRVTPLAQLGGTGLFTKALQRALLAGEGDVAVHSLKDLPSATVPGLALAACLPRAGVEDVLVSRHPGGVEGLPEGARVGTGSARRRAFLGARRPDLELVEIRGNVPTRKGRVAAGDLDAVVLARAGLERLGLWDDACSLLDPGWMVPAACQGTLGLETLEGAPAAATVLALEDPAARAEASAERGLMAAIEAGCSTPVGALARAEGETVTLRVRWASETTGDLLEWQGSSRPGEDPAGLGARAAAELRAESHGGDRP